jgi:hypothetical protein
MMTSRSRLGNQWLISSQGGGISWSAIYPRKEACEVIVLKGTAKSGDTFYMRLDSREEVWVKPTPVEVGKGLEIGAYIEVFGDWSRQIAGDEIELFSAREIRRIIKKTGS